MNIIEFDEIDSTNDFIRENRLKLEEFTVVSAKNQLKGKGRRGNTWVSEEGMAFFSFLVKERDSLNSEEYIKVPLIAGISLLSSLKKVENLDYKFKWTNDVYLNDKKLSGILVEKIDKDFIVGIGLNVNNIFSDELKDSATSLFLETDKKYEINKVLEIVISDFKIYYDKFTNNGWDEILKEINEYNFLKNKEVSIKYKDEIQTGKALEIHNDGRLEVEINGKIELFNIGEIHINKF